MICAVKGCHNSTNKTKPKGITFHIFPGDPVVAARWTEQLRLNRKQECWKPSKHTKICSAHFDEKEMYYTARGLCRLKIGAVPTKHLHICCQDGEMHSEILKKEPLGTSEEEHSNCGESSPSQQDHLPSESELDSAYDTALEASLRKKLKRKTLLQHRNQKQIRTLNQKLRRLKKRNDSLKKKNTLLREILSEMEKKLPRQE